MAEYRKLTAENLAEFGLRNNIAFALFYAGEFPEARKTAETLSPQPIALIVACETAINGSQSGLAEARRRTAEADQFKQVSRAAGQMLANLRKYPLASDLLEAGALGESAAGTAADAITYRKTQPHEQSVFPDDPIGTAMRYDLLEANPDLTLEQLRSQGRTCYSRSD